MAPAAAGAGEAADGSDQRTAALPTDVDVAAEGMDDDDFEVETRMDSSRPRPWSNSRSLRAG